MEKARYAIFPPPPPFCTDEHDSCISTLLEISKRQRPVRSRLSRIVTPRRECRLDEGLGRSGEGNGLM